MGDVVVLDVAEAFLGRVHKLEAVADEARGVVAALEGAHFDCSELADALKELDKER